MSKKLHIVAKTINDIRLMVMGKDHLEQSELKTLDEALAAILEYLHTEGLVEGRN